MLDKRIMRRNYSYRLYPTKKQTLALESQLAEACDLYNSALQQRKDCWKDYTASINFYNQSRELKALRAEGLVSKSSNFWSQQVVLRRLDATFAAFYRRCKAGDTPGYPRFKSLTRFNTLEWSFAGNSGGVQITKENRLYLQGIGHIKVKIHRDIPKEAKLCTAQVTRKNGKWYVGIALNILPTKPLPKTNKEVGIDVGITIFAATSDGELILGPRTNRAEAKTVRRAQRKVARRKKGSNRRRKAVLLLAKQREKEANRRRDHAHKTARDLINRYDKIYLENLNLKGLTRGILARDIHDQGWGQFISLLQEKAEEATREVILVDPKNTSQICSNCGNLPKVKKTLDKRVHSCSCGLSLDRDLNAALNILTRGIELENSKNGGDAAIKRQQQRDEAHTVA